MTNISPEELKQKIADLQHRLDEAEQLIEAIKAGEVDAFAVNNQNESQVYTLQSGDYAYRVLVEEFSEGALNLAEDGMIVYTNVYFTELLGQPYDHIIGTYIFDLIHSSSREIFKELFEQALTGKSKGELNFNIKDKVIPVYVSLTSLKPTLNTIGMIITDLSEKREHEKIITHYQEDLVVANAALMNKNIELNKSNTQLNETKNFLNNILESTNHGVLAYEPVWVDGEITDFIVRYANDIALEQLQLHAYDVIDKSYNAVMPLAKQYGLFDKVVSVYQSQIAEKRETRSPHNPDRWFIVNYVPSENAVTTTFVEITEQKRQARILFEKNLELEHSNSELASFNYIASHDLQEPLRKIQTFTNRILEKEQAQLSPAGKSYFQRIVSASVRMQNLIEALLDYSRASSAEIIFQRTDLNILAEEVRNSLTEMIEENNVQFIIEPLPTVNVIPHQFNQLFLNIVANAIKYRREDVQLVINIKADIESVTPEGSKSDNNIKYWKISISDNGIGFEQKYADKIFELFQRLHGKSEYEGTGIGLAICQKIIQNHHGFIRASGIPGAGAEFDIYLPVGLR